MRGGRLFLLLGVVIAALAALLLLFFLQPSAATPSDIPLAPTPVPNRRIVVARSDIPANTVLTDTETFLTTEDIPETEFNAQPGAYFTSVADLNDKITVRQIAATERIMQQDVRDGGLSLLMPTAEAGQPAPKAIPFQVGNLTGVADLLQPGDFVDLVVTFQIERDYIRPSLTSDPTTGAFTVSFVDDTFTDASTKTLVQNIQVLRVLKPRVETDGTPTPAAESSAPATGPDGQPVEGGQATQQQGGTSGDTFVAGNWIVVLAVTDQEAEIIRYSLQQSSGMALVLRGRGDTAVETTLGVTMNILMSQFGLPQPQPQLPPPAPLSALTPTPGP
jgi:pilus assembly protein CpaB